MSDDRTYSGGVGVTGLLQVAFIILKILDKITWSWWWVLAPTWIGVAIFLFLVGLIVWVGIRAERQERRALFQQKKTWDQHVAEMKAKQELKKGEGRG
jgi:hypothetical protein